MNVSQIKTELKAKGIEFTSKAKKVELVALLEGNQPSALTEPEPKKETAHAKLIRRHNAGKEVSVSIGGCRSILILLDTLLSAEDKTPKAELKFLKSTIGRKDENEIAYKTLKAEFKPHFKSGKFNTYALRLALARIVKNSKS